MNSFEPANFVLGSQFHIFEAAIACVFTEVHKQPQFTCQANAAAYSSLTPSVRRFPKISTEFYYFGFLPGQVIRNKLVQITVLSNFRARLARLLLLTCTLYN